MESLSFNKKIILVVSLILCTVLIILISVMSMTKNTSKYQPLNYDKKVLLTKKNKVNTHKDNILNKNPNLTIQENNITSDGILEESQNIIDNDNIGFNNIGFDNSGQSSILTKNSLLNALNLKYNNKIANSKKDNDTEYDYTEYDDTEYDDTEYDNVEYDNVEYDDIKYVDIEYNDITVNNTESESQTEIVTPQVPQPTPPQNPTPENPIPSVPKNPTPVAPKTPVTGISDATLNIVKGNVKEVKYNYDGDGTPQVISNNNCVKPEIDLNKKIVRIVGISSGKATVTINFPAGKNYTAGESRKVDVTVSEANYSIGNTYYTTLQEAIAGAKAGDTITLVKSVTDSSTATINKDLTLNLNGNTLTRTAQIKISSGKVRIVGNGKINNNSSMNVHLIYNVGGTLTLDNSFTGTIENNSTGTFYAIRSDSYLNISGSNVKITGKSRGVYNYGTLNMSAGTIDVEGVNAIITKGSSNSIISGGNIKAGERIAIDKEDTGTLTISGGTISTKGNCGIWLYRGKLKITGGTITGLRALETSSDFNGEVIITGGTLSGNLYGIYDLSTKATLTIGELNAMYNSTSPVISGKSHGIYSSGGSTVIFYNGIIKGNIPYFVSGPLNVRPGFKLFTRYNAAEKMNHAMLTSS